VPQPDERKNEGGRHEAARFAAQREVHVAEDPGVERGVPARGLVRALVTQTDRQTDTDTHTNTHAHTNTRTHTPPKPQNPKHMKIRNYEYS